MPPMRDLHSVVFRLRLPDRPPTRRRLRLLAAASGAAVLTAGCSSLTPPAPLAKAVSGAVLTVVTAEGMDPTGIPVKVTPYFVAGSRNHGCLPPPTTVTTVTAAAALQTKSPCNSVVAIALVGRLPRPTPLVMTWSRETPAGPQVLFSKRIMVTSDGLAYMTAVTDGTIPFGTYQVVASIGTSTRMTSWAVFAPGDVTAASFAASGRPLTAGRSGAFPAQGPVPEICSQFQSIVSMPTTEDVRIDVASYCPQGRKGAVRGAELATMNRDNGLYLLGRLHLQPGGMLTGNFILNVCKLPDASDLPGATIWLSSIIYYHGNTRDFAVMYGLPPEHAQPAVTLTSTVPAGTTVHPGEHIVLDITGIEPTALGPQEGVRFIALFGPTKKGPYRRIRGRNYAAKITACDPSRLHRTLKVRYTVPTNAPKVLTLTAIAADTGSGGNTTTISWPVSG
jgi:hypothetical protein